MSHTTPSAEAGGPSPAETPRAALDLRIGDEMDRERARREARRRLDAEARGPITAPEILTLRERLDRPRPAARWRIEGWQPADSRVILAAPGKGGKTTLIGGLIRSLVDGDAWLDSAPVTAIDGTVALLDCEMSPRQLDEWLATQKIRHDDRVIVIPLRGRVTSLDLLDPEERARWAAWLRDHHVAYLILDCLRPLLDALRLDESHEAGRLLVALDALLTEAGIREACLVHHMGHTGERSRGDSRLRDWPDVEWRLVRQEDDPARYIAAYGRDVEIAESRIEYDAVTRRCTLAGGSRRDVRTHEALDAVINVLRESSAPMSTRQILAALADGDHSDHAIRDAVRAGVRDHALIAEPGPRRAILHRIAGPVSQCVGVRQQCVSHSESECVSASIGDALHTLTAHSPDRVSQSTHSQPVSQTPDAWADLPQPSGSVEAAAAVDERQAERRRR